MLAFSVLQGCFLISSPLVGMLEEACDKTFFCKQFLQLCLGVDKNSSKSSDTFKKF